MNQRAVEAEGLIIPPIDGLGRVVFETPTLVLAVPPTEHINLHTLWEVIHEPA